MSYVTIEQLCKHSGKSRSAVCRALKATQTQTVKQAGVKGVRIPLKAANRFLGLQWPGVGEITQQQNQ